MIEPRNPFMIQTSEQIDSERIFLRLFSPGVLSLLTNKELWDRVSLILSSPGGGKSSLIRLFTPGSLLELHNHRTHELFKELYQRMNQLSVINDNGPQILGISISCVRNYDSLEDLTLEDVDKKRLFFALLDSRIIISALRGLIELNHLKFNEDLKKITFELPPDLQLPIDFPQNGNGQDLFAWAQKAEENVYSIIDSFGPIKKESLKGHDRLISAFVLKPDHFKCNSNPIPPRVVVMLDDCHKLTTTQRKSLYEIIDQRPPIGIWIAERLDHFSIDQLINKGAYHGREINFIELEDFWSQSSKFEKIAENIADKRARFASTVDIQSFAARLQFECDDSEQKNLEEICKKIEEKILNKGKISEKYIERIESLRKSDERSFERAISWRSLEILIDRDLKKEQKLISDYSEDLVIPIEEESLVDRENSDVRNAAELFLSKDYKLPYYYGMTRLVKVSSSNISQFLWISGNIFEEILAQNLMDPSKRVGLKTQEKIIKKIINERWDQLPYRVQYGREIQKFLTAVGKFCANETYKANAWNAPGVTGIAILMSDVKRLNEEKKYKKLNAIMRECIANKLLEASPGKKCKNKEWMVLYFNRMYCVHFNLPLQYSGKFKEKKLDDVLSWIEN
jgi:hypothetical protein